MSFQSKNTEEYRDIDSRIVINVGGKRFETQISTFSSYPDSLLGTMFSARNTYLLKKDSNGEIFFDRNPDAFQAILHLYITKKIYFEYSYRTGNIYCPKNIPKEVLQDEIDYFGIVIPTTTYTYIWGKGEHGQLGTGDRSGLNHPVIIDAFNTISITQISLGTSHTLALTKEGKLYSWGYGGDGRLGHGNTLDVLYPKIVETLINENIIEIKCGELHSAALTKEGTLYTWGLGSDGRLGHGNNTTYDKPMVVLYFNNNIPIESISCGGLHCGALSKNDHKLYTWGYGNGGRLGHKDSCEQTYPKLVESLKDIDIIQVSCGGHHTAALSKDGKLYTWGFDDDGRLGHGKTGHCFEPKIVSDLQSQCIVKVSCGCWHTAALTKNGDLYCWGSCKSGQLGNGSKDSTYIPYLILQNKGVIDIACGTAHTAALTNTGKLYTWGKCDDGRLGYKTDEDQVTPRVVDSFKDCNVKQIFCGIVNTAAVVEVPQI